jgi:hypothetical protein
MSLFTSGDNGTFDNTTDPNGNPPSDWNITKAADAIVRYTTDNPITGTGSMHCESRTIFNDDYALQIIEEDKGANTQGINIPTDFYDFTTQDFSIELRHYLNLDSINSNNEFPQIFTIKRDSARYSFRIIYVSNGDLRLQWYSPSNRSIIITPSFKSWIHLVVTFEHGVEAKVSKNGVISKSTTDINIVNNPQFENQGWFKPADGNAIDCKGYNRGLRIYNKALTDVEIASLYNSDAENIQSVPVSAQGNLIQEFLCNQEQGLIVFDTSVNETNLELVNYSNPQIQFGGGAWVDTTTL